MKKKKIQLVNSIMIGFVVFGIGALAYPFVSEGVNTQINQYRIDYYQKKSDKQQNLKRKEQMKKENALLAQSGENVMMDPFEKKQQKGTEAYSDHIIGSIIIPEIKVRMPIYDKTNDIFLQKGIALLDGTSFPIGGENTHAVLSAHSGLPNQKMFTDLDKLENGDYFILHVSGDKLAYRVYDIQVVEPSDISWIGVKEGEDIVTLMTCTPYLVNTHRLLVTGYRIPYEPGFDKIVKKVIKIQHIYSLLILCGIILVLLICIMKYRLNKKKHAEKKF